MTVGACGGERSRRTGRIKRKDGVSMMQLHIPMFCYIRYLRPRRQSSLKYCNWAELHLLLFASLPCWNVEQDCRLAVLERLVKPEIAKSFELDNVVRM